MTGIPLIVLEAELALIDERLRQIQLDKEIDKMLYPPVKRKRVQTVEPVCYFHVITEAGTTYQLQAETHHSKDWATKLHKETECIVRQNR